MGTKFVDPWIEPMRYYTAQEFVRDGDIYLDEDEQVHWIYYGNYEEVYPQHMLGWDPEELEGEPDYVEGNEVEYEEEYDPEEETEEDPEEESPDEIFEEECDPEEETEEYDHEEDPEEEYVESSDIEMENTLEYAHEQLNSINEECTVKEPPHKKARSNLSAPGLVPVPEASFHPFCDGMLNLVRLGVSTLAEFGRRISSAARNP